MAAFRPSGVAGRTCPAAELLGQRRRLAVSASSTGWCWRPTP